MAHVGLTRRTLLHMAGAAGAQAHAAPLHAAEAPPSILVVDRAKVLDGTDAAGLLIATETALREAVQARLERVKSELEAEERTLTEARANMPAEEFARRSGAFDRWVRAERREAQERGARLLQFLEESRGALLVRLPQVLEELRIARGAALIIDAAAAAAYDADLDATADAVALFNERVGDISFEAPPFLLER
ncbi:MAG: Skp family chaperone for outer membrane protein [Planctomycetota bacterium]